MTSRAARVMDHDSARMYQGLVNIVKETARICSLRISSGTSNRWADLVHSARLLDAAIDEAVGNPERLMEFMQAILLLTQESQPTEAAMGSMADPAVHDVCKIFASLAPFNRTTLALLAARIMAWL